MTKTVSTDKRKNNGGHKTAGRKAITDKKVPVQFYAKTSDIELVGGMDAAREISKDGFEKIVATTIKKRIKK